MDYYQQNLPTNLIHNNNYTFTAAPHASYSYIIECWGAQGGANPQGGSAGPGKGGYTSGSISLAASSQLYIVVGSQGQSSQTVVNDAGGYNGGGAGGSNGAGVKNCSGGGGATDIRVVKGSAWNTLSSLRSRIMVAAGGGGCGGPFTNPADANPCPGGYGGGLSGGAGTGTTPEYSSRQASGGTQTSAGSHPIGGGYEGAFGYANQNGSMSYGGGGGGGWYGGGRGHGTGGGGGSSFISGHTSCNAINPSTGAHLGASTTMTINNVNYKFTSTSMKAGNASQTKPGGGTETGHSGNGYARITLTRW